MPLHRAAEISYYEELGVEPDASPAQIRESFRALVRLLHPDRHADPELKVIADRQLRRVNRIYAVLSDAEKRRRYDLDFNDDYPAPGLVFNPGSNIDPKRFVSRFLWIGAAVMLAAACLWLYVDNSESPGFVTPDRTTYSRTPVAPRTTVNEVAQLEVAQMEALRSDLRNARFERDAAISELNRLKTLLARGSSALLEIRPAPPMPVVAPKGESLPEQRIMPVMPRSPAASAVTFAAHSAPPKPLGSDPHQFVGFWFYAPGTERTNKSLYEPQFIEAILTERNGVIHGKYRSRYRIVDRAISPDVNFEFSGTPAGVSLTTPWTGLGGAKGQLILSLTGENSLKFDWTTSELGSAQGLSSGTATLMRRIE